MNRITVCIRRIAHEPLVHFLALGAAIFVAYSLVSGERDPAPEALVVKQGALSHLAGTFTATWRRPPSQSEFDALVRDYVKEEVFVREALALGLDRDDVVIRRRLRQKLEFIADGAASLHEPTDEELRDYLAVHTEAFRTEAQITFQHVFVSTRRGEQAEPEARRLLAQLERAGIDADTARLGDGFIGAEVFDAMPLRDIAQQFGPQFADQIATLPAAQWQGPIRSSYGLHLVVVRERTEAGVPPLQAVRADVRREWLAARRTEENEKYYQSLLKRYTVTVEPPREASAKALQ